MRRVIRIALGVVFMLLGVPGLFLPILQGWLFLALGALCLSVDLPIFHKVVRRVEARFPKLRRPMERLRRFLEGPEGQEKPE